MITRQRRAAKRDAWLKRIVLFTATTAVCGNMANPAFSRDYFNPALLETGRSGQQPVDLSVFENGNQVPGKYRVDIWVNDMLMETRDVRFVIKPGGDDKAGLQPCLTGEDLQRLGVKIERFPALNRAEECANLAAIPQASAQFQFNRQRLVLSIPQAALENRVRGYVPPELWDEGMPAMLLNYGFTGSNSKGRDRFTQSASSYYLNLRPGFNLGAWRVRNYTTWSYNSGGGGRQSEDRWDTVYTYAQRNIISMKSLLTLGESSSPSDVFDSVSFRGAQLASDDDMLPESLRGYAPVVRGIARSNAQVVIRQNGYVIYQSYVAPGAFEISDMYPTGGSGDLDVTIKEADGSEQHMTVPFASLPVLQREGRLKYALTTGQYRTYDHSVEKKVFSQGSLIYGLPAGFTLYGGGQFAGPYQSLALGVGKNLGEFGALSVDATQAWAKQEHQPKSDGQSWRVRYSKNIVATGTNFAIAGYRYSTSGYYGLQEVLDTYRSGNRYALTDRRKNRAEITLNQNLWEGAGSLSLSAVSEDYWNSERNMQSLSAGYNNSWNGISYGFNYSYNRNSQAIYGDSDRGQRRIYDRDQLFAFNISVPLEKWLSNTYATYSLNTSQKGNTSHTAGLNGTALAGNNLNWSVQEGYGNQGQGNSGNANLDWRATYGELVAGYAYDRSQQRVNYGVKGGVIAHEDGVTFGQPFGETAALVTAAGASDVAVGNQVGVKTDWRGYAIVPYATPYRNNSIRLDVESLPDDVDLALTNQSVTPTRGAVSRANFKAHVGKRILMRVTDPHGVPLPLGASVRDADHSAQPFLIGGDGLVYLSGMAEQGRLVVQWGRNAEHQCRISYQLPAEKPVAGIQTLNGVCQ
ncbi:fimbria/pilus outer membrane usher protein [Serratia sp. IR-2025]